MNEKTLGIVMGIVFTIIIMAVSVSLTLLWIYYSQPHSICELCHQSINCSFADLMRIVP